MGDGELVNAFEWRPRCYLSHPKLSVWPEMPTSLRIRETENMPREGNRSDPFLTPFSSFSPDFPNSFPKHYYLRQGWEMNEESSWPRGQLIPHTSCKRCSWWRQWQSWGNCSVGNLSMGLRTIEYQTNETERLLEEKAISAFKDAVKTHGRAGH